MAQAPETAPLGLMLIQTAFEEFTSPREDLAVTRKEELHRLMLEQVPVVLNILSGNNFKNNIYLMAFGIYLILLLLYFLYL